MASLIDEVSGRSLGSASRSRTVLTGSCPSGLGQSARPPRSMPALASLHRGSRRRSLVLVRDRGNEQDAEADSEHEHRNGEHKGSYRGTAISGDGQTGHPDGQQREHHRKEP